MQNDKQHELFPQYFNSIIHHFTNFNCFWKFENFEIWQNSQVRINLATIPSSYVQLFAHGALRSQRRTRIHVGSSAVTVNYDTTSQGDLSETTKNYAISRFSNISIGYRVQWHYTMVIRTHGTIPTNTVRRDLKLRSYRYMRKILEDYKPAQYP